METLEYIRKPFFLYKNKVKHMTVPIIEHNIANNYYHYKFFINDGWVAINASCCFETKEKLLKSL